MEPRTYTHTRPHNTHSHIYVACRHKCEHCIT